MEYEPLFVTMVGSHVWGMERPESDKDYFKAYIAPSKDFLIGKTHMRGHEEQSDDNDISSFEIGHVIKQLKKGNLNHLIGVMSHLRPITSSAHERLIKIVKNNIGKNCFRSIKGMAWHNYKRYFEDNCRSSLDAKNYKKKLGQVGRVIQFGINILTHNKIEFNAVQPESRYDIEGMITRLENALEVSILPEKPPDEPFDEYLLGLRLERL